MNLEREKIIDDYLEFLKYQKNYSDYTIKSYENDIMEYFNYINSEGLNYKDIEYSDIRFYLMYLKDNKKDNNASIDRKLSALRGFYKYLVNENILLKCGGIDHFRYCSGTWRVIQQEHGDRALLDLAFFHFDDIPIQHAVCFKIVRPMYAKWPDRITVSELLSSLLTSFNRIAR